MLRSMNSAISGLRNHQIFMDVIGNNIANVNTTAFKASRVTFQDMLYETIRGALSPAVGRGGINALQVGMGVALAAIDPVHSQGALVTTGKQTDLAIQGEGFFVLSDGFRRFFSRDGAFDIGADSVMSTATGLRVMGWQANLNTAEINTAQPPTAITIPVGVKMVAKPTSQMQFIGNLNGALTEQLGSGVVESTVNDGSTGFAFLSGESLTFNYDGQAYITTTAGTSGGSLRSGVIESTVTADTLNFDIAATDTITFSYDGQSYTTQGLNAGTRSTTTLADVATDLQNKMRAAVDAVQVPLGVAANTDIVVQINNGGLTAGLANDGLQFTSTVAGLAFAANASSNAGLHVAIQARSTESVPVNASLQQLATDIMRRMNAVVPLTGIIESASVENALSFDVLNTQTLSFNYGGVQFSTAPLQAQTAGDVTTADGNGQVGLARFAADLQAKLRAAGGTATSDISVRVINQLNRPGEARLSITGGRRLAFDRNPVAGPPGAATTLNSLLQNRAMISVEANDDLGNVPGEASLRFTAPRRLVFANTASDNTNLNTTFQNRRADGFQTMLTSMTIFDSLGNPHGLQLRLTKSVIQPAPNQSLWNWDIVGVDPGSRVRSGGQGTVTFDSDGLFITTTTLGVTGPSAQVELEYQNGAATPQISRFDFSEMTQLEDGNTVQEFGQDGFGTGTLVNFIVGQDGVVTGNFSNGQAQMIAQVAVASFANPSGLEQLSQNLLIESANSGLANVGSALTSNRGAISAGALEASNVELAQEFTNMIRAERGFQANSRVITTSDELLQDLVNLKR